VGLPGGIQVKEPATLNPVVVDTIHRVGGTCSPDMQWPEAEIKEDEDEEGERFERVERLMHNVLKKVGKVTGGGGDSSGGSRGPSGMFSSSLNTSSHGDSSDASSEDVGE